jgi:hypothetical protein
LKIPGANLDTKLLRAESSLRLELRLTALLMHQKLSPCGGKILEAKETGFLGFWPFHGNAMAALLEWKRSEDHMVFACFNEASSWFSWFQI